MSEEAINQINNRLDETYHWIIDELRQENQQLKDRNKLLEKHYKQSEKNLGAQIDITLKYEKVLDEIREYINTENYKDENICVVDGIEILQILDKVGKE